MLANARLTVDLRKIAENVRSLVTMLAGIELIAVTKGVCGSPEVARAMLAGGAVALADSRHENAQRLRDGGIDAPIWLLRAPPPARADDTVRPSTSPLSPNPTPAAHWTGPPALRT